MDRGQLKSSIHGWKPYWTERCVISCHQVSFPVLNDTTIYAEMQILMLSNFIPASLNSQTTLLLVNANNFKSPWEHKFEADRTRKQLFHLNSTTTTEVDMMSSSGQYSYAQLPELNAQLVVLPYKVSVTVQ